MADSKVISKHLPTETEENNETPQSKKEPDKFRSRSGTTNNCAALGILISVFANKCKTSYRSTVAIGL